jgi:hypothetical protein
MLTNTLIVLGIAALSMWFSIGMLNSTSRRRERELKDWVDEIEKNIEADLDDDLDERVREKFGNR